MGVTEEAAGFAVQTTWEDLDDQVRRIALDHILDTFGVMLAGSPTPAAAIARSVYGKEPGASHAVGTRDMLSAPLAALANGVAGHALDYDDTQLATSEGSVYGLLTHPSTPVLAAAAALGEEQGRSGRELITAYVVGVEVACRVADAIAPRHYEQGFHSTGTLGTLGAAAAAGNILRLDEATMRRAFGIAASMAAGLRENFGTMTKPLHAGRAAQSGVIAALLAKGGFTASDAILEAPRGFFSAAGGGYDPAKIEGRLGKPFFLSSPGVSIKPYPSGSLSHPAIDAALAIVRAQDLGPQDVRGVYVGTHSLVPNALLYKRPRTELEAKFSMEYCMATAVVRRRAGLAEFTDEAVLADDVQAFLPKVRVAVEPEFERMGFQHTRTRVRVTCKDGRTFEKTLDRAVGYPDRPLSEEQMEEKFRTCAARSLPGDAATRALAAVRRLPGLSAREVLAEMQAEPRI